MDGSLPLALDELGCNGPVNGLRSYLLPATLGAVALRIENLSYLWTKLVCATCFVGLAFEDGSSYYYPYLLPLVAKAIGTFGTLES